jgi:hypothetical protein
MKAPIFSAMLLFVMFVMGVPACAGVIADLAAYHGEHASSRTHASGEAASTSNHGVQLSPNYIYDPDHAQILVNADVGHERWAITAEASNDTLLGNVFMTNGTPPAFLWCEITDIRGQLPNQTLGMECFGADTCPPSHGQGGTCYTDQWGDLGRVELPATFLMP